MAEEKEPEKEKKIIVDEDWKAEAQKEKEVSTAREKTEKEKQQQKEPSAEDGKHGPLPPGNFAALVSMLTTQALFAMGMIKTGDDQQKKPDLEMARYNIDMLQTLEEKTKGNLTEPEEQVLKDTLNQIRMAFVKVSE